MIEYDKSKVDEVTLALLFLVTQKEKWGGYKAWKGFDWETMNRLHSQGYISDPKSKTKSVAVSEEGFKKSQALFEEYFTNN